MTDTPEPRGRAAIVTGAGKGLGRAYALEMARRAGVGESQARVLAGPIGQLVRALRGAAVHGHASANDSFTRFLGELDRHTRAGIV